MRLSVVLWSAVCMAQVRPPADAAKQDMLATLHELVRSINNRQPEGILESTVARFDAGLQGEFISRDRLIDLVKNPPDRVRSFQLATLFRTFRLLSADVALGDGYYRTMHWPGGESAGRVSVTLVREDGRWRVATARFGPYRFDDGRTIEIRRSPIRSAPGTDGWITLFDGRSTGAFITNRGDPISDSWRVEAGTLKAVAKDGASGIRTTETFDSFELRFEWKAAPKGNSGVKYRLFYLFGADGTGHEYQVVDNDGDPGANRNPVERAGGLYSQIAPSSDAARAVGEWNESRIIVRGRHCEHWLNGGKVVEYETESDALDSPLLFQHHSTTVWYRNIRVRRLTP